MITNKLELLEYLEAQQNTFYQMLIGSIKEMSFAAIVAHFKNCIGTEETEEQTIINLIAEKL
jgi:ABC-type taurine transport system ATPase subunit